MKKKESYFTTFELLLFTLSLFISVFFFFIFRNSEYLYLISSLIGVTALLFVSKGNPVGQILTVVFSVFYGIVSYSCGYYGEMITYLGMTTPIAILSIITWIKNPSDKNKSEVKVNKLKNKEYIIMFLVAILVTGGFYFILDALNTNNLIISTISVFTSFIAAYLSMRRSRFYALGYALNDIILIILWVYMSIESANYISMVICFVAFLVNDLYGFINWTRLSKKQMMN
ncbi:nicotinamide riboside transporter PnuC [Acholeplasma sp. OttesenSCG-928-E16]|nr:nicotinamide riboside transporter PnuC [Acholeplasma sp. OttesenSCG-928-E16]